MLQDVAKVTDNSIEITVNTPLGKAQIDITKKDDNLIVTALHPVFNKSVPIETNTVKIFCEEFLLWLNKRQ